jgi:hypothetical protein
LRLCDAPHKRKGMDGLAALVRESLGGDPYSGVIYVFRAKRADRVKLLLWDGTGLVLVAKRLEKSSFRWPRISAAARAADVVPACPIGSSVRSTSKKAFLLHYSPTSFFACGYRGFAGTGPSGI